MMEAYLIVIILLMVRWQLIWFKLLTLRLNKPLSLFGPNQDIDTNTGTRVLEATVDGGSAGNVFNVNANSVTINGFTITNGYNGITGETSFSNFVYNIIYGNLNIGD